MKVRALASLSGAVGDQAEGDEFSVDAARAKSLIDRGLVEEVKDTPVPKADKAKE
ncbi:hypothetical protein [Pseudomonas syringae]|uniref:Uncharacterized protein n=1 Tax=Pseudomonas syringae pv. aceris TaxID=199198 RepID=A0A0L8IWW4_PSESX|nr:hypothetical protein [Pseudomonas syringae]EGH74405.1 hypothetical protein PSYAR_28036 [Pseudomonas syringae pv. aceris str. M302273]KOG05639.1 Uncharacterized protein ABJ98_0389 [Pseudomonas syringae pv. aceris]KPW08243.1 Uncharacterized protein ALO91_02815 [Pseudomonas syringae pv. aceris]